MDFEEAPLGISQILYVISENHQFYPPRNKQAIHQTKSLIFTYSFPLQHALLKFQYDEKIKKRSKRTPVRQDCREHHNYTDCCRYPLIVDFDEMQWDFIITPRRYEAFHCSGECPLMYKHSLPHTHLVEQMKKGAGGPCCSPKKMNSITMLYFTPRGTILFGKVGGMVVETCGCS